VRFWDADSRFCEDLHVKEKQVSSQAGVQSRKQTYGSPTSLKAEADARDPPKSSDRFEEAFCASNPRLEVRIALREVARSLVEWRGVGGKYRRRIMSKTRQRV
jgi:hypothetical protein